MGIYTVVFFSYFKQYMKKKSFFLYLLIIPLMVTTFLYINTHLEPKDILVGYGFEGDGILEKELSQKLESYGEIHFVQQPIEDLQSNVSSGEIDLAYIFPMDMEEKIYRQEFDELIQVITLEGGIYHGFIKEDIYGILYDYILESIALEYLTSKNLVITKDKIKEDIEYRSSIGKQFIVELSYLEEHSSDDRELDAVIYGWKIFMCFYLLLLTIVTYTTSMIKRKHILVSYMGEMGHKLCALMPIHISTYVSVLFSLFIIKCNYNLGIRELFINWIVLGMYYVCLILSCSIIVEKVNKQYILLLTPYICIFILLTHGFFWNISNYIPTIDKVLWVLPSYQLFTNNFEISIIMIAIGLVWYYNHHRSFVYIERRGNK